VAAAGIAFDMPEQDSDSDSDDSADVARGDTSLPQQTDAQVLLLLLLLLNVATANTTAIDDAAVAHC
jgi:hypothetical protein